MLFLMKLCVSSVIPLTIYYFILFFLDLQQICKGIIDETIINDALKLESDRNCETKLFFKMDRYYETEGVVKNKLRVTNCTISFNIFHIF